MSKGPELIARRKRRTATTLKLRTFVSWKLKAIHEEYRPPLDYPDHASVPSPLPDPPLIWHHGSVTAAAPGTAGARKKRMDDDTIELKLLCKTALCVSVCVSVCVFFSCHQHTPPPPGHRDTHPLPIHTVAGHACAPTPSLAPAHPVTPVQGLGVRVHPVHVERLSHPCGLGGHLGWGTGETGLKQIFPRHVSKEKKKLKSQQ